MGSANARIDWTLVGSISGAVVAFAAATTAAPNGLLNSYLSDNDLERISYLTFAYAVTVPTALCWWQAIADGRLAAKVGAEPSYEHVNGWSAVFLIAVIIAIGRLVWWAATSDENSRKIHADWGIWVVSGLTATFVLVAAAPLLPRLIRSVGLETTATEISNVLNLPIRWVGTSLSSIDGVLVFAVAAAAGTTRRNLLLRYFILASAVGTCAVLGYYWEPPWSFIPIAWGFILAFSISRRWAWIEEDRDLAMLNPTLSQAHIRVGFNQNLRDEALLAFLSMFLLVPLALRQGQLLLGTSLFSVDDGVDIHPLIVWIGFYGTELAKAVPFVDWAEVYHVEGQARVFANTELSKHVVFATRVLIDLVFLAALLQAISSASRDAQQRDLFYRKRAIKRLDPFTEPEAFRALVKRTASDEWAPTEKFDEFPDYDMNRLVELSTNGDERIRRAAELLRTRQGGGNDPHYRLSAAAADRPPKTALLTELIKEIEELGPDRNIYQLDLARRRLVGQPSMAAVRRGIVRLISEAPRNAERTLALVAALTGESREPIAESRLVALEALQTVVASNLQARAAVRQAADYDGAARVKRRAREILRDNPETPD
jgi:hypothetical protein